MKIYFTSIIILCIHFALLAQLKLDVEGDTKFRGKLDFATVDGTSLFIGTDAGKNDNGENENIFIGKESGIANTSGHNNIFVGENSGVSNIDGYENTFVGEKAGEENTSGFENASFGHHAGKSNNSHQNTFIGTHAGFLNAAGSRNTMVGESAGASSMGSNNVYIGGNAGGTGSGSGNVFIGFKAGTNTSDAANRLYIENSESDKPLIYGEFDNNIVKVHGKLYVEGADIAEKFVVNNNSKKPGMLVSMDVENHGELIVTEQAYDKKIAGVISGAKGIQPGMILAQENTIANGDTPVALSGRVYVYADASRGSIKVGDLLTSSNIVGHVMKVKRKKKAYGAIVGKAMEPLENGQDLILVLLNGK